MGANRQGLFFTFEGIEGCGKSTQVRRLARHLKARGIPVLVTKEPGGTLVGKAIRKVLLDSRNTSLSALAELMLYAADRAQHVVEVIQPALNSGKWVLCDRFTDATEAYQGWARGQDRRLVRHLNRLVTRGLRPDRTFLLDLPVEVGLGRAIRRNHARGQGGQDRFEKEALSFHHAVRAAYMGLAKRNRDRFIVIDADAGRDEVEERLFRHIRPLLAGRRISRGGGR